MQNEEVIKDKEFVLKALKGDLASFGILFAKLKPSLHAHAIYLLGYTPQAEDAVSDTFIIAATKLGSLKNPEAFNPWLHAILKNVCRMYWRERSKEFPLTPEIEEQLRSKDANEAEEFIDRLLLKDQLWGAIESLSDTLRTALMLRYFTNFYSYEEISKILQIPEGTVKSRLSEAKNKLKVLMEEGAKLSPDISKEYLLRADYHKLMWGKFYQDRKHLKDYFTPDVYIHFPQDNVVRIGLNELVMEIESDLRAHTILNPQAVTTSSTISILEGKIINSPKTPERCPPNALAVLFHKNQRVQQVYLYLADFLKT
jgi:RNA polymerase sigma factor (sigma-70 family)